MKLELGKTYIIKDFWGGGKELAKVIEIKGLFRKRYKAQVWGVTASGYHQWPNGSVSYYENWLSKEDVEGAKPYEG